MTDGPSGWYRLSDHDRDRLRGTRRLLLAGVVLGILAAAGFGLLGFDGRFGFIVLIAATALGAVVAALTTVVVGIVDEARRAPVSAMRIVIAVGLFAAGAVLLTVVAALAGTGR